MIKNKIISSPNIAIIDGKQLQETKDSKDEPVKEKPKEEFIPPTRKDLPHEVPEEPEAGEIQALVIDGKYYPLEQFWSSESSKCDDEMVWRTDTGKAFDIDAQSINEGTDGCRFGLVADIPLKVTEITDSQIQKFEELTGIKISN